jgi:peptidyl-prolyl cis-trans isomerase SurA
MSPNESITSITTGTSADEDADPFASKDTGSHKKVRISGLEPQAQERSAKEKLAKAETKAEMRPIAETQTESATEKHQAAPLGLDGDSTSTGKKHKYAKHTKGEVKQRMQEQAKPVEKPSTIAPTVNPELAAPSTAPSSSSTTAPPQ